MSEDPEYTDNLFETLRQSANQILAQSSIYDAIEVAAQRLINEFTRKYGNGSQGVSNYIKDIF